MAAQPGSSDERATGAWLAAVSLVAVALLTVMALHVRRVGELAIRESDQALAAGDLPGAIARARDAAMAVAPFSPYPQGGYARLLAIAENTEAHGSFDVATLAWRATFTAIRSTRTEDTAAPLLARSQSALLRLASRSCEGQTRLPSDCSVVTQAALGIDPLPPLPRFGWLGFGTVALLGGGAAAAESRDRRRRLAWSLVMAAGGLLAAAGLVAH